MDPVRFDRLTRVVSAASSRRALIGLVAGVFSAIAGTDAGDAKPKRPCKGEQCLSAARRCNKASDCPRPPACKKRVCRRGRCEVANGRNGTRCTHPNPCIKQETCQGGKCKGDLEPDCVRCDADPAACDELDIDQCQEAVCSGQGFCKVRDRDGAACDHENPCVAAGTCAGGALRG